MASKQHIAVDIGAESGRTIVGRFDGRRLTLEETYRFANVPVRVFDTLYWDALRLWQDIQSGIGSAVQAAGPPASIGIDTWGVDYGLIGRDGSLIANPIHYRDQRTDGILEWAFERVPRRDIYLTTGLQFMKFNTLFQLLAALREQGEDTFAGVVKLLFMPDLFNYFLTGVAQAEYTIASTSQMLDASSKQWSQDLLERFGIPTTILPGLTPTGTRIGPLFPALASQLGAAGAEVVATAGHDTASAVAAVPAPANNDRWCYISSGTWSLMGAERAEPTVTESSSANNFTNEGGVGGTVRFLKNIMGLWLVQKCRQSFERDGSTHEYAELTRRAARADAFGPIVNPDDETFLNPDDMPTAIRAYCTQSGQAAPADEAAVVRCCLDSLALCYRRTLAMMEKMLGGRFDTIHIVGGGSRNRLLCQLTADCCQRHVVAGPDEATAMGNCLVQLIGSGDLGSLADARSVVRSSTDTEEYAPDPSADWDSRYERFERLFTLK